MSEMEKRLVVEGRKIAALRDRIQQTAYLKASEVRKHLSMSAHALDAIPFAVLPYVPGNGRERVTRRYHPADVEAYPARARRWRRAIQEGREAEALALMEEEIERQDRERIEDALRSHAAA